MIAAWWRARASRERQVLVVGGLVAVIALVWALVWHPLGRQHAELALAVEAGRAQLVQVRGAAAELGSLRAAGTRTRADREGKSLLALADATARSDGLESALRRVEPVASGSVRVSFEYAAFDDVVAWLERLARDYGIQASDFSADRVEGVGLVNARVTLQDAP